MGRFYEWCEKNIMQVKDVCKILQGCSSEEVYDGRLVVFFVWMCAEVSLYVGSYEYGYVYD